MSRTSKSLKIRICDNCRKEVTEDENSIRFGGSAFNGWYSVQLDRVGKGMHGFKLHNTKSWDFCSKDCLVDHLDKADINIPKKASKELEIELKNLTCKGTDKVVKRCTSCSSTNDNTKYTNCEYREAKTGRGSFHCHYGEEDELPRDCNFLMCPRFGGISDDSRYCF